ncbi:adenylate/guanylate cyclase domain-containing protein [Aquihabitans daechungensis]|uniref:adenylate/guanylate cyclase domain-containing protein n=1 Tax=Aquihabitans daechungensis TaxID=1052257 RepID=UPI003BA1BE72
MTDESSGEPGADHPRLEPPDRGDLGSALDAGDMTELLRAAGLDDEQIAKARGHNHLEFLAIEHLVIPEEAEYDLEGIAEASGLTTDQITRLWRSLGFAEPRPGDHLFTDVDVDMLRTIGQLLAMGWIDNELTFQMARVIGSSLSRVASALIDNIDPGELQRPLNRPESDDGFAAIAPLLLPMLLQVMDYVWRRHVQAEARARMAREHAEGDPDHRVVGFADLVGFTALSQQVDAHELAGVVDRFETIAYDTVNRLGGRVVKMIGDEVMFSVPDEASAVAIALSLSETYRDDDELSDVRVGLAAGPVLQREADLYGPVVNRASRIVNIAFPGSVVVSGEIVESLATADGITSKSIGSRNLKDIGKVPLFLVRRESSEDQPRSSRQEAERRRAERREARVAEMEERRHERRSKRAAAGAAGREETPGGASPSL